MTRAVRGLYGTFLVGFSVFAGCSSSTSGPLIPPATDAGSIISRDSGPSDGAVQTGDGSPGTCTLVAGVSNNPNCNACAQASCCTQVNACAQSQDCIALEQCVGTCLQTDAGAGVDSGATEAACIQACGGKYPNGQTPFTNANQCVVANCNAACG
jgi:hypothetical protein